MVYMLLGTGFEETEAIAPLDLLRRADIKVQTVGITGKTVVGSHGIPVVADLLLEEMDRDAMDMIVLPGGLGGVASIRNCPEALDAVRYAWEQGKFVAAICAGPTILSDLGITAGKTVTCYPSCESQIQNAEVISYAAAIQDGNLITAASAGCAVPFGLSLITALKGKETADRIAEQIVIR